MLPRFSLRRPRSSGQPEMLECHQCQPPWWPSSHQVEPEHSPVNESSPLQLTSQMSTPRPPGTPGSASGQPPPAEISDIHPNGHAAPSPNYVTITTATAGVTDLSYASLTPLKTSNGNGSDRNGTYVTYVEATEQTSLFTVDHPGTTAEENGFPVYTVGESGQLYHASGGGGHYYETGLAGASLSLYSQQDEPDPSYCVPSGNNNSTDAPNANIIGQPVSHATRVSPATVQWLLDNYETAEGVSLPRSTLYYHYIKHTHEHNLDPVNAASFGKLIRSVFLGLRTRRLGTRGNSKYHYYGIRVKSSSPLNALDDKAIEEIMNSRFLRNGSHSGNTSGQNRFVETSPPQTRSQTNGSMKRPKVRVESLPEPSGCQGSTDTQGVQRFLGDSSHVLSSLPELDLNLPLPEGLTQHDLKMFQSLYRELCSHLLRDVMNFQFTDFQKRWRIFFRTEKCPSQEMQHYESLLPQTKLCAICTLRPIQDYVRRTDYQLYQNLTVILLPDVLRPIPSAMTQTIRNFAKVIENCMAVAMSGFPEEMVAIKLSVLSAFGQTLRRHTSLNHLAQAARAVLQNEVQINQMLNDLNRVDFSNVEEQASWVCGCTSDIVPDLEGDFKSALAQHQSLEEWASWLESVVDRVLRPHENTTRYTAVARYFLLKWSFYSSLVIRDLTLRSAASFGSFHLLRLLYDEYMFYLIENRVARAINTLPIAVLGKKLLNPLHHLDTPSTDDDCESFETCQFRSYANSECQHDSPRSTGSNGVGGQMPSEVTSRNSFQTEADEPMMVRRSFKKMKTLQ